MRYKILFISSWFPSKIEPTNGNFVQRHAEAVSLLHDVEILHAIGDFNQTETYLFDDQMIHGNRTLVVYYKNSKNPVLNFYRRMISYKKGFSKLQKPDLVHANVLYNSMYFAVYLEKQYKIPFVVTEHWTALRRINANFTPLSIKFNAKIIGNYASKILPVSKDLEMGLRNLGIKSSIKVIPNVVNTALFSPKTINTPVYTFIHISNLIPRKNADKILKVALILLENGHRFKLQIGGDGDTSKLSNILKDSEFKDNIEILGTQKIQEIAERMKRADCFILFSDDENQPCVIAESFASGIKVISTNVGGIAEFFPLNAGVLLERVEESLLEHAMIQMMNSENLDKEFLARYAHNTFSTEVIAKEYSNIYFEILGS